MNEVYLQKACGVETDGIIGPITRKAYALKILAKASQEIGIRETSRNQGEGIAKYWTATDYPDGYRNREPYCAAFVCWILKGIFAPSEAPRTALAFGFEAWGRRIGLSIHKPARNVRRGDIVVFGFSHVGIASSDSDAKGNFETIEANTTPGVAGNEGGGVYRRIRNLSLVRSVARL